MDKQELNKKLAEWSGEEGNYTQSLDACFKWLVPKLSMTRLAYKYYLCSMTYEATVWAKDGIWREGWSEDNAALALCLAIEKLIDGGK